jgi:hypothetical protein
LAYNAAQYIISGTFGVEEFIFDVVLLIWPMYDLQIQDGRQFLARNGHSFKVVVEHSYYTLMKALFMQSWVMDSKTISKCTKVISEVKKSNVCGVCFMAALDIGY